VAAVYDRIGNSYRQARRQDRRLADLINDALGEARTVLNVGAGTGSYEPKDRRVVAVEPSLVMLSQHSGATRVQAIAEELPFADQSFDASMAVMTVHHWSDLETGLREMGRVSRRQVVFTWDPSHERELWFVSDYLPEIREFERTRFRPLPEMTCLLQAHTVRTFEIPFDFADGFQTAFWRRPEAYLDPNITAGSSTLALLPEDVVARAIERLRADLQSGAWLERHSDLLTVNRIDYGYRLLVAGD
jgi:SAM-dependent methyltransferase